MKKFLLGFIIGVILLLAFFYFGGAGYLKAFGTKTEETGAKLEVYEKEVKKTADEAKESVTETAKDAREAVDSTVESTKKVVDKTTEKVKGYMPK
ncbi:MAG: hypothetical protein AABY51_01120 [Deltaproteobacteria bacterium]